ncbi:glyoxalase/bleomycin resistance protein/dioxygenase (plasmid) [Cupriavidus necator N-1]|uniref:Glyoxalase/bleomycin resistance protein/dioxygenase n=1 Tax=Cupriavidus necator (strain ATCC 43291 / DSM 13513 / CCUG 52238 / LMG 8453 / N-1) TaxID=1042878 RepID=F8GYS0_CUPNN|nr:VOC family protein [Cupriavidus necator]AEI83011.1 glyoxalase/bleomycin resistance protein/dioxygenase [Cupriavidus necator N-1]MDX6008796.1 VOC family protein [Cupriavidus necator]
MPIQRFSHVAYRCADARKTVDFYTQLLGLEYAFAVAENYVPSTGQFDPHIHVFLRVSPGSYLAFFELSEAPEMGFDPNTPDWVQHIALHVPRVEEVKSFKEALETAGIAVLGITDHGIFKSIYFRDPSGHRVEITCESLSDELCEQLGARSKALLDEWSHTRRAPDIGIHRSGSLVGTVNLEDRALRE